MFVFLDVANHWDRLLGFDDSSYTPLDQQQNDVLKIAQYILHIFLWVQESHMIIWCWSMQRFASHPRYFSNSADFFPTYLAMMPNI